MQNVRVSFHNTEGQELAGILSLPAGEPRAYALFAHCFTCGKNLKSATDISAAMVEAGLAVLRFDFTGLGQSEGSFDETSFSSNVDDLLAACQFLEDQYAAPAVLVGHSLGGTAVLQAAPRIPSARAVATIGSPADPEHVTHLFADQRADIDADGKAEVLIGGRPFTIRRQFVEDLRAHDLPGTVGRLRKALLVMHAPLDDIVALDNASALFAAAKHPKSFISLDGADHLLSGSADSSWAGRVLAAWASRYLPEASAKDVSDDALGAEGDVVALTRGDGFVTEVNAAGHRLIADEPASVGGSNLGPTPYGLLSGALAACTSMTLRMYAAHKKLDLESVEVRVAHRKIHAEDCRDCESKDGRVDEFVRTINATGSLTDAQHERLLEIADRCPVHRTLEGEVKIRTSRG